MKPISIFLITIFIISFFAVSPSTAETTETTFNFELTLQTQAASWQRMSAAYAIQQALIPLGIKVNIEPLPFGTYIGKLFHLDEGNPFDLAVISFAGGGIEPDFMWKLHSDPTLTSFGVDMYQLNDPDWQAFQEADTGVRQSDVDQLLEQIEFSMDRTRRINLISEFNQLYFEKLLYDYPLFTTTSTNSAWLGYGDDDNANTKTVDAIGQEHAQNDLWNLEEGALKSRALGATWNPASTPQTRMDQAASLTLNYAPENILQLNSATPGAAGMFDPYQVFDTATGVQSDALTTSLLEFDGKNHVHPGIAYNYIVEDWDKNGDGSNIVNNGKWTFFINSDQDNNGQGDFIFPQTIDYLGNSIAEESVDANDFSLALQMMKFAANVPMNINGFSSYYPVNSWEVRSTAMKDDTLVVYMDSSAANDITLLGGLNAIPEHILNNTLTLPNGTLFTPFVDNFNPQTSVEWTHWTTSSGISLAGPYQIDEFRKGEYISFSARTDFPFPNEWDMETMYNTYATEFDQYWMNNVENKTRIATLSHFAPHIMSSAPPAYYWAFADDPGTTTVREKPRSQGIEYVIYKIIDDTNAARIAFEAGQLDFFGSSALGADTVQADIANPEYVVKNMISLTGPQLLVFNLLNDHLQKRDVRVAIANAINTELFTPMFDNFAIPHYSVVWRYYSDYYSEDFGIHYDPTMAQNLMRANGYSIPSAPQLPSGIALPADLSDDIMINLDKGGNYQKIAEVDHQPEVIQPTIEPQFTQEIILLIPVVMISVASAAILRHKKIIK